MPRRSPVASITRRAISARRWPMPWISGSLPPSVSSPTGPSVRRTASRCCCAAPASSAISPRRTSPMAARRRGEKVDGWLVLDKPAGMTSTQAVGAVRRLFQAAKAGHGGTLDPLATGLLPIALGEATKTVPYVMDGRKVYQFTVRWGEERDTDDAEGRVVASSAARPTAAAVEALLPHYIGTIEQVPPCFSAIKIEGERAYDIARQGESVAIEPRPVEIHELAL